MDPSCFLTSSDFVCTVCIFSKAFEADHKSIGLPVKEAGLVYLLATRHLCNCRVVCCALVLLKHPIKHTVVGLWENDRLCVGFVFWLWPRIFTPLRWSFIHSVTVQTHLIIKLYSLKHELKYNKVLIRYLLPWLIMTPAVCCSFYYLYQAGKMFSCVRHLVCRISQKLMNGSPWNSSFEEEVTVFGVMHICDVFC